MTAGTAPTLATVLRLWTFAPVTDVIVALLIGGYFACVLHHRRSGQGWPSARSACALTAAALMVLVANGALAVYGRQLFWVHMVVHLLLIMVIPAFVVWAQPVRLLREAGGPRTAAVVERVAASGVCKVVTSPWFAAPLYAAVLVLTHLTGFQQAMSQHMWLHHFEQAVYLLTGFLLLLRLLGGELTAAPPLAPFLRFVVMAFCMGPDTLVGVVLMMTGAPIAPTYAAGRDWGPSAVADQSLAGAIMWFGGDGLMMALMLVVAGQWVASGDRAAGLGVWLDRVRAGSVLGEDVDAAADIDDDEAALTAYNARLAKLHTATISPVVRGG